MLPGVTWARRLTTLSGYPVCSALSLGEPGQMNEPGVQNATPKLSGLKQALSLLLTPQLVTWIVRPGMTRAPSCLLREGSRRPHRFRQVALAVRGGALVLLHVVSHCPLILTRFWAAW